MTKDGLADKIGRALKDTYDYVLIERLPDDIRALVERLDNARPR